MIYRPIGKTGMSASVIGLGGEYLDHRPYETSKEVIEAALGYGINIIDVFMPGKPVRENIAKALGKKRSEVLIQGHIGSIDNDGQYDRTRDPVICKKYFEELLQCFGGYIDLGMMFYIDTEEDFRESFETEYLSYVLQLKKEGKIRAIGASCHDPAMGTRIAETGVVDMMMFSVNIAYDMLPSDLYVVDLMEKGVDSSHLKGFDPERARFYELCEKKCIAITTMKTLGAGKLISPQFTPFAKPLSVGQCIHYALSRPAVVSTLIGCKTRAEVEEAVRYLDMTDEERDYTDAVKGFSGWSAKCVYCSHCQPCPIGIDVAAVTKLLDIALLDKGNESAELRGRYAALDHKASECTECGGCEERCPFGVKVTENMCNAARIFE